ncbi:MAG TPA: MGMT family protein [Puia sp.]|nr:MGMT family protein [Puia sp.]
MPSKKVKIRKKNQIYSTEIKPASKKAKAKTGGTGSPGIEKMLNKIRPSGKREESFFELVYEVARQIPFGRVTSYGAIAACLGTKLSARMVGWAMSGADKVNPTVPAHRVVNRVGLLSGKHHFKPPGRMEKLLKKEGILVKDDVIVNFKEKFWDPSNIEA